MIPIKETIHSDSELAHYQISTILMVGWSYNTSQQAQFVDQIVIIKALSPGL